MTGVEKRTAVIKRLKKELKKRSQSSEAVKTKKNESNLTNTSNLSLSASNLAPPRERDDDADKAKHNEQIDKITANKDTERMKQRLTQTLLDRYGPNRTTTDIEKERMTQTMLERYGTRGMPQEVATLLELVGANPLPPGPPPSVPAELARATEETGALKDPYKAKDVVYVGNEPEKPPYKPIKIRFDKNHCLSK